MTLRIPRSRLAPYSLLLIGLALLPALGLNSTAAVMLLVILFAVIAFAAVLRDRWNAFALYLFLLAPHVLIMALLYVWGNVPAGLVKGISAWKEILLLYLIAVALLRAAARPFKIHIADLLVLAYSIYVIFIALLSVTNADSAVAWAYGVRDALLLSLLYVVGRTMPLNETIARRIFFWMIAAAFVFSLLGVIEYLFVPTEAHVAAGIPRYFSELLETPYPAYLMGLPPNFWVSSNSGGLRRAVSIYGSSQPFALSFLMLLPFCLYGLTRKDVAHRRWVLWSFLISLAGLALTLTRFTILVCVLQIAIAAFFSGRRARKWVLVALGLCVVGFFVALTVSPSLQLLVQNTLSFEDHSSSIRLEVWSGALQYLFQHPLGTGLLSAGSSAARMGTTTVDIEGQISKIAVEQGFIGLVLYVTLLAGIALTFVQALRKWRQGLYLRGIYFSLALAFIGLLLNSLTTEWHNSVGLMYPIWILAGAGVTSLVHANSETVAKPVVGVVKGSLCEMENAGA